MIFAWDQWNAAHIARHNVAPIEAEYVIEHADKPVEAGKDRFGDMRYMVMGQTLAGRYLRVAFVFKTVDNIDPQSLSLRELMDVSDGKADAVIYVIHAMELDDGQKKWFKKWRRNP